MSEPMTQDRLRAIRVSAMTFSNVKTINHAAIMDDTFALLDEVDRLAVDLSAQAANAVGLSDVLERAAKRLDDLAESDQENLVATIWITPQQVVNRRDHIKETEKLAAQLREWATKLKGTK